MFRLQFISQVREEAYFLPSERTGEYRSGNWSFWAEKDSRILSHF